jgi:hypothetical protein
VPEEAAGGIDDTAAAIEEELLPKLADVVDAALGVGAALTRTLAQATTSRDLPPVGEAHLQDVARFGATAVGNLLGLIVDGARAGTRVAPTPGRRTASAAPAVPTVTAGSTLRVPLLVENTGTTPTPALGFTVAGVERLDGAPAEGVGEATFSPESLVVGARDFEKLTVRIRTTPEASPGRYRVTVEGGDGWFSTSITLDVVAA